LLVQALLVQVLAVVKRWQFEMRRHVIHGRRRLLFARLRARRSATLPAPGDRRQKRPSKNTRLGVMAKEAPH
jgi:hypothetical protein